MLRSGAGSGWVSGFKIGQGAGTQRPATKCLIDGSWSCWGVHGDGHSPKLR